MNFQDMKKAVYRAAGTTVGLYAGLVGGGVSAGIKVLEGKPEEAGRAFNKTGENIIDTCSEWAEENGDAVIASAATAIRIIGGVKNIGDHRKKHV